METAAELKDQLVDSWRINARLNHLLLEALTEEQLAAPLAKGKAVLGQFAHIHNVRRMWLLAVDRPVGEALPKLEGRTCAVAEIKQALTASDESMTATIDAKIEAGKVPNFKPHPVGFLCYFVAHESNHRAQVEVAVRQAGLPISDELAFSLWKWGSI